MKQKVRIGIMVLFAVLLVMMFTLTAGCEKKPEKSEGPAAEEEVAEAVPVVEKHFEDVVIYFESGGPPGCPWGTIYMNGAIAAEKDLGCKVYYTFADWNPEKMITNFKNAIAAKPDGIVIMGHPGQDAFWPLVDQAESEGIVVTLTNTPLSDIEAKYKGNGFGYVGAELYEAGVMLGEACVDKFGLKPGDRSFVWGLISQPTRGLRSQGCIDALEDAGLTVDYLEISPDINADASLGTPVFAGYVASNPDVKLVITDHGGLTGTLEPYLKGAGKGPDDIWAAGFDVSSAIVAALKNGYIDLVADQQPYLQGYFPILQICLTKYYGFSGLHIDTGAGLIDKNNIDLVAALAEKQIR